MNNISFFPNNSSNNRLTSFEKTEKYATISVNNDGGGTMGYVTNERFDAKMEVIDTKLNNINDKIDFTQKNAMSELKLYINTEIKNDIRWTIGIACTILGLVITVIQKFI